MGLLMLVICGMSASDGAFAQTNLEYQNRTDRYEGIRPKPVSGYDIEVISVLADYQEPAAQLPERLRVWFYLANQSDVYLTVREQDFRFFYWLDKVKPSAGWQVGGRNEFAWSTGTVLKQLSGLNTGELGVLVRLRKPTPSVVEDIAPAILYSAHLPDSVHAYVFTLKANDDAKLSCSMYKDLVRDPLVTQHFRRIPGGRPFTFRWDAQEAQEAMYRLVCDGYFLGSNQRVEQTVRFYHKPLIR
jgi:hypothetical protein